jgi:dihydroorotase
LETALALVLSELVDTGALSLAQLVDRMAHAPRRILGIPAVTLSVGAPADLTIVDTQIDWEVCAEDFASKSKNSAFIGRRLKGRATDVFVGGQAVVSDGRIVKRDGRIAPANGQETLTDGQPA